MNEPSPAPPVESLTREQATAEFATMRDNPDLYDPGRPGYAAATARMNALDERLRDGPAPAPSSPSTESTRASAPAASTEDIAARLAALSDPHAEPQTAAELSAMPPPAFSPDAEKAGWRWDTAKLPALYATAEQEGLGPLVRAGMHVITRLAAEPALDLEGEERAVIQGWGPRFSAKMDAVDRFEALVRATHPEILTELERTGKSEYRLWLEFAASSGEQMMDPTTPGGERRLKEKYRQWAESQTR